MVFSAEQNHQMGEKLAGLSGSISSGSYSAWRLVTNRAPQGCILGPVLSNMFTNNQEEEEVKHTLIKFANHTKTERVAVMLEGRAAVQSRNLTLNKGKCRVLLLGWTNPSDGTGLGADGLDSRVGGTLAVVGLYEY